MPNPDGRKPESLVGQRFCRLVVIDLHHYTYGHYHWNVQCDCGNMYIAKTVLLRNGKVKSCGCLKAESKPRLIHGHTSGRRETRTHKSWSGMMARCYTPTTTRYADWGGRGIRVCERWHIFENFLADMGECPEGKSIDRYPNNDGNYEPGNVRWATPIEQRINSRPMRAQHKNTCIVCGSDFMSIMARGIVCSDDCRKEHQKLNMREKRARL